MAKQQVTILSGAGMSAESGIRTFRDAGGLWEEHRVEDVATPEAWQRDPQLVLKFYNQRRKQLLEVLPNAGHLALKQLEEAFDVRVITQNVDDLHERAGSTQVLHLHGELRKSRSTGPSQRVNGIEGHELNWGDLCAEGFQLRPHIVWFGEEVVEMDNAASIVSESDAVIIVGTSMNVYPANGLIRYAPRHAPVWVIDPNATELHQVGRAKVIARNSGTALPELVERLLRDGI
ncbi:MAG: NAD-dependent deacylase [Flavobacteriales bacterium]|nr:NAD-dependent deacylase [Flavobacteriales bacterium]